MAMRFQRKAIIFVISVAGLVTWFSRCELIPDSVTLNINVSPLTYLSEYHFFTGEIKSLQPNKGVLPFEPITPLFSDYAEKSRFVWMPPGTSAVFKKDDVFEFPIGSVLIKNFYYPQDFTNPSLGRKIIETRLLVRREEGWDALPYIWNDEQTDAKLEIAGDLKVLSWINNNGNPVEVNYLVPNKNQCKGCHVDNGKFNPIGPKARYLNADYIYDSGSANQLKKWVEQGYLSGYDSINTIYAAPKWDDPSTGTLKERAMAYLEVNCGTCHSRTGPANTSGLYLTLAERSPAHLGVCKSPVAAGKGTGGFRFDISPGKPEESILVFRMESTDPSVMMPELGRSLVHEEGVALIKEWISSMDANCN